MTQLVIQTQENNRKQLFVCLDITLQLHWYKLLYKYTQKSTCENMLYDL